MGLRFKRLDLIIVKFLIPNQDNDGDEEGMKDKGCLAWSSTTKVIRIIDGLLPLCA